MKKTFLVFLFLFSFCLLNAQERSIAAGERSAGRLEEASLLVKEYCATHSLEQVKKQGFADLLPRFEKMVGWDGKAEQWTAHRCEAVAREELQRDAEKQVPFYSPAEEKAMAEKKYPLYQINQTVQIYYREGPRLVKSIKGLYRGMRGGFILIGGKRILLQDMRGIEGNDEEILKFDQKLTAQKREQFIQNLREEQATKRKKFLEENQQKYVNMAYARATRENEKAGFICGKDGIWIPPETCLRNEFTKQFQVFAQQENFNDYLKQQVVEELALNPAESMLMHFRYLPQSACLNPIDVLREQKRQEQLRKEEAERFALEQAAAKKRAAEAAAAAAARRRKVKLQQTIARVEQSENKALIEEYQTSSLMQMLYIVVCIAMVGMLTFVIWRAIARKRDRERFTKFFEGKGKVQKAFWGAVAADPDHFKYVAYLFPDMEEAAQALVKLSYVYANEKGEVASTKENLQVGTYPHQGKAVAFVGGTGLHYALWREASAVLPEVPNAVYFKVSTEPEVQLVPPTATASFDFEIENLGEEEVKLENGQFAKIYHFRVPTEENAQAYLAHFDVHEDGIIVYVAYGDEGKILAKDVNGIFDAAEQDEALAEDSAEENAPVEPEEPEN